MRVITILSLTLLFLTIAKGSELSHNIEMTCGVVNSQQTISDDSLEILLDVWYVYVKDYLKGFHGTIGVVGGSADFAGATYFAAITALVVGADDVKIFCDEEAAQVLKRYDPNLSIFETLKTIERTKNLLELVDVVLLGPGLEKTAYSANVVVPMIINYCKAQNKPLVIDLDAWFWKKSVVDLLAQFPENGVILTVSQDEFTKIYGIMKKAGSDDKKIELDEEKFGPNIYILRRGCINRGISVNKEVSWHSILFHSGKKGFGQDQILSGATAAFYFLAMKHLEVETAERSGSMYHAGIATYAASKLVTESIEKTFNRLSHGMVSSDIIDKIKEELII